jgi:SAM-dependent methyltransferase
MTRFHPESPDVSQEDLSRLRFVADFRKTLHASLAKGNRAVFETEVAAGVPMEADLSQRREAIRQGMEAQPYFRGWSSMLRSSQDLMWDLVGQAVDAQLPHMAVRLKSMSNVAVGALTLAPDQEQPAYITDADIHRMPGGYAADGDEADMRSGALYDLGGAIYQLGVGNKAGGLLNDSRGRTLVAHLNTRFPGFEPRRILDMGCGVGHNTIPLAAAFPEAETIGIDVGAALLRYAHLRAEGLGQAVHFIQDNAEHTRFEDASFDLVVSQIVLHETSPTATARIFAETRRLLQPGGVFVHLEVPLRADQGDDFHQFMSLWEEYYNLEPNISGVMDDDLAGLASSVGLTEVQMGYQSIPAPGSRQSAYGPDRNLSQFAQWLVVSGRAA